MSKPRDWQTTVTPEEFARRISQFMLDDGSSSNVAIIAKAFRDYPDEWTPGHGAGEFGLDWTTGVIPLLVAMGGVPRKDDE